MKKTMHYLKIFSIVFLCAALTFLSTAYVRYRITIQEKPLDSMLQEIRSSKDYVTLEQMSPDFIHAILAVEDPLFYDHNGIVFSNIMTALFTNLKEKELVMGGSTITQQLSKNLYLDQKKTFHRKVAELFFVHDLESSMTKDEILETYLNIIYYGDGHYGIKQASEGYFHVAPSHLSIAQATLLAGLPQAPAAYQLSDGLKLAKQRQRIVLNKMKEQNYIKESQITGIYNASIY